MVLGWAYAHAHALNHIEGVSERSELTPCITYRYKKIITIIVRASSVGSTKKHANKGRED